MCSTPQKHPAAIVHFAASEPSGSVVFTALEPPAVSPLKRAVPVVKGRKRREKKEGAEAMFAFVSV